jgi:flagellar hook-associated protein 3 FlgL
MIIRSTLFSRLGYMSQETSEVTSDLAEVQKQITTGKRLNRMSQEPWSVAQIHQLREKISIQTHYQESAQLSVSLLGQGENALDKVMNIINRVQEVAVQMSNDTYGDVDLATVIEEVTNLKDRVRDVANAEFNGRYVFSGTAYDTPPFDAAYAYQGTTSLVSVDVSSTSQVEVGFDGSDVFQGSTDVFLAFDNLITGLTNNDDSLIQGAITDFDDVYNHINETRTRIGTEMNIAMDMQEISQNLQEILTGRLSDIEDADIPAVMTKFSMLQTQYQINLQLTAQTRNVSLFERM